MRAVRVGRLHRSDQGLSGLPAFEIEPVDPQDAAEPAVRFDVRDQLARAALAFGVAAWFVGLSVVAIVADGSAWTVGWMSLPLIVGLALFGLAVALVRDALRGRGKVALVCDGLLLAGRDLEEPIPVRGTTFELRNVGGIIFVALQHRGAEQVLATQNWRTTGGMTLREALPALGLTPAEPAEPLADPEAYFVYGRTWGTGDRLKLVASIAALGIALGLALSGDGSGLAIVLAVGGGFTCIHALRDLWRHRHWAAGSMPALARDGDRLVSPQFDQRLAVEKTTFELSFADGRQAIVLRTPGVRASLDTDRWTLPDGTPVTKDVARATLLRMGLDEKQR